MKEAVKEERRWEKEGEGGIRRGIEWLKAGEGEGFCRASWGREFLQKKRGRKVMEQEGKKTGGGG